MSTIIETLHMIYDPSSGIINLGELNKLLSGTGISCSNHRDSYGYWYLEISGNPFKQCPIPEEIDTLLISSVDRDYYVNVLVDTDAQNIVISPYPYNYNDPVLGAFNFFYGTSINDETICYLVNVNTIFSKKTLMDKPFNCTSNTLNEEYILNVWNIKDTAVPYNPQNVDVIPMRIGAERMKKFYICSKPIEKHKEVNSNGHIYKCIDGPRRILYRTV